MIAVREVAAKLDTNQLMHIVNNNPERFSLPRIFIFCEELSRRVASISDVQLKLSFNVVSRQNNLQAMLVYGNELEKRGFVNKEGGIYYKIGNW